MHPSFRHIHLFSFTLLFLAVWGCTDTKGTQNLPVLYDNMTTTDSLQWWAIVEKVDGAGNRGDLAAEWNAFAEAVDFCKRNNYPFMLFQVYNIGSQRAYVFGDIEKGDIYLDSAAWVVDQYNLPQLRAQLNLAYAARPVNAGKDSALHYFTLALQDTANLIDVYKKILYASLAKTYILKAYYKEAKFYAEKALELNHLDSADNQLLNEIHFYQYIHVCEMGMKDTVAAFNTLQKAYRIMMDALDGKGDETIYRSMSQYYLDKHMHDSALFYLDGYEKRMSETRTDKMHSIPQLLRANIYARMKNYPKAEELLNEIEEKTDPTAPIIGSTRLSYYETKYEINKHKGDASSALAALESLRQIETLQHQEEKSLQLAALEERLTQARAEKTISEKEQEISKQKLYTLLFGIAAFLITIIGFLLYRNQRRKKLLETQRLKTLEQQTIIDKAALKLQAENQERKRISKEIHDDIGPALTTLSMAANLISTTPGDKNSEVVSLIRQNAQAIGNQINEIIWSLNSHNDNLQSLVAHIRKFADSFVQTAGMQLSFQSTLNGYNQELEGYKRRSIYLSVKEVLNNAVKYSKATQIDVKLAKEDNYLNIAIRDNGAGLPGKIIYGNGLENIKESVQKMNGNVSWENIAGLSVKMSIPLIEV